MLEYPRTSEVLNNFGKEIIRQSRANLTRKGKRNTGGLYKSLGFDVDEPGSGLNIKFEMNPYGEFVDKGVSGKEVKYNTPFSYKGKMPPKKDILKWVKSRGLRFRDAKGKFSKGNQDSLAFLIQRSIFNKGIKPTLFFTRPFEKNFPSLIPALEEAFAQDTEDNIDNN